MIRFLFLSAINVSARCYRRQTNFSFSSIMIELYASSNHSRCSMNSVSVCVCLLSGVLDFSWIHIFVVLNYLRCCLHTAFPSHLAFCGGVVSLSFHSQMYGEKCEWKTEQRAELEAKTKPHYHGLNVLVVINYARRSESLPKSFNLNFWRTSSMVCVYHAMAHGTLQKKKSKSKLVCKYANVGVYTEHRNKLKHFQHILVGVWNW